ncbi:flagellar motor switch protein FliM [Hydrogenispora ethanolica]|uniref:Flagellar motor switch protein FliM n=1 Tax=Hydrogenispora ethanolica TaxID=1082276 RepID=A0A4R1RK47_HYDET|nr:flagellar motor switch protein FliM [Hydrogenispora ethanolica]TCL66553.1 flagellar motor switch protein FliM [Hydrogenispora ethanolica]
MAEVLSQSEIDALLEALSSGTLKVDEVISEEKKKKVKPYDFRRPNKLSKDQLRTLVMLHENFARLLTTSLSTYLRSMVRAQVVSIDQLTYEEFTKSLNNPTVMTIISLKPLEGNIVMELSPQLAFAVVDRLLGGQGNSIEKIRELTDIEQTVIKRVILKTFTNLKEAWKAVIELEPAYETLESNPLFTQIVPPADMIILVTLEVRIAEAFGMMNICMPFVVIEPILDRLNAQVWFTRKDKSAGFHDLTALQNRLGQAKVPLIAELGRARITVGELLNLGIGDVLQLDQSVKGLMDIKIANQVKFRGSPGVSGNKMAIQIGQILREEGN